jgi:hypothetical protein
MYLFETINNKPGATSAMATFGVRPPDDLDFDTVEVWSSSFKDPGPDFNEFRLFKDGQKVETYRINGY